MGTYACEELCHGAPLPLGCMAVPPPGNSNGDGEAFAWRFLTQEEFESQFMSVDPMQMVLYSTATTPEYAIAY